jgi:hypothetical protein
MTVKELKELLKQQNDEDEVYFESQSDFFGIQAWYPNPQDFRFITVWGENNENKNYKR